MRERLFFRLAVHIKDPIDWCIVSSDGLTVTESGRIHGISEIAELTQKARGRTTIGLVPGSEVLVTSVNFPASQRRQIRKALPFMLEEQLVDPLENSHFSIPAKIDQEQVSVVVTSKDKMAEWLELFEAAQMRPDYLIPDCLCLPNPEHAWVVLVYDDYVLTRESQNKAWVAEAEMYPTMLDMYLPSPEEGGKEQKEGETLALDMLVYGDGDGMLSEVLEEKGINIERAPVNSPICLLAESFDIKAINLLQGEYSLKQDYSALFKHFKSGMIAASVLFVVQMAWLFLQSNQLESQYKALKNESTKIYREVLPKGRITGRAKQRLQAELKKYQSGVSQEGFLALLESIHSGFKTVPGVKPASISYNKKNSQLKIDVNGPDIASLEKFKDFAAAKGYEVSLSNVSQKDDGHRGRVMIGGKN